MKAFTVWFTGITQSGKTTVASAVADRLRERGLTVEVLDSGRLRREINRSLGFTREEVEANILRLGYECRMLNRNGVIAVAAAVSPYRDSREKVREAVGRFVEVYCRCPMEELVRRDDSGLFERARRGEVDHVAGVNAPYEEPPMPEVVLDTDRVGVADAAAKVLATLEILGMVARTESAAYTPEEEEIIRRRLQDLGYL
jgi:adenylyl-sulfate kinase